MKIRIVIEMASPGQMGINCQIPEGSWPSDPAQWSHEHHFLNYIAGSTIAFIKTLGEVLPAHAAMMEKAVKDEDASN